MNSFQTVGHVVACEKKRDSMLVTVRFDNTSANQNNEVGDSKIEHSQPVFVGEMRVRMRKGILGRINESLLQPGRRIEIQGFIQGVRRTSESGNTTLDHELIAVRVVPAALDGDGDETGARG